VTDDSQVSRVFSD